MSGHWQATILAALISTFASGIAVGDDIPVTIRVNAAKSTGELKPIWRFFGVRLTGRGEGKRRRPS